MSTVDRRRFLQTVASAVPAGALAGCATPAQAPALDAATLGALAETVLPVELAPDGVRGAVERFRAWLAAYRPAAEMNHGYGTGDLVYTPAHPGPGWAAQLEALDLEARQRYGAAFSALEASQRTAMVRQAIARERADRLGDPAEARHVATGLMAHFFGSAEAADLCHGTAIGKYRCRDLGQAVERPSDLPRPPA
ncbi:MAG TPA: gluconate 2-dehydrogenase subunit 3 family protein [Gemmatimonadales bacterium]|nr:gluconate 2-dehydrogenase subunit 3 family protein [Gemmatimonadales bacterium]